MSTGVISLLPTLLTPKSNVKKLVAGVLCLCLFLANPIAGELIVVKAQEAATPVSTTPELDFKLPHPGYISTYFSSYHPGIDIASGLGMPIHPIAPGKVVSQGLNFWGLGLVVEIEHEKGYRSLYAHMGKIYTEVGQDVTTDSIIGEVGLTGRTSGPHTHLEIRKDNQTVNPVAILPKLPDIAAAWGNTQPTNTFVGGNNTNNAPKPTATPTPQPSQTPSPAAITEKLSITTKNLGQPQVKLNLDPAKPVIANIKL